MHFFFFLKINLLIPKDPIRFFYVFFFVFVMFMLKFEKKYLNYDYLISFWKKKVLRYSDWRYSIFSFHSTFKSDHFRFRFFSFMFTFNRIFVDNLDKCRRILRHEKKNNLIRQLHGCSFLDFFFINFFHWYFSVII